ncbi:MAG: hypothetical protein KH009_02900 [Clostridiales bacterium]|nr:hypothetical protein [Clostridiales bacterium]
MKHRQIQVTATALVIAAGVLLFQGWNSSRQEQKFSEARQLLNSYYHSDAERFARALNIGCVLPDGSHNREEHAPCVLAEQYGPHCTAEGLDCLQGIPDLMFGPDRLAYEQGAEVDLQELTFIEGNDGPRYEAVVAVLREGKEQQHRFQGSFTLFPTGEDAGKVRFLMPDDQTTWQYYLEKQRNAEERRAE